MAAAAALTCREDLGCCFRVSMRRYRLQGLERAVEAGRARGRGRRVKDEGRGLVLLDRDNIRAAGSGEKIYVVLWIFAPQSLQWEVDERA